MSTEPVVRWAIHATAVAIDGRAVVIRGPSRSGKSTLALDLIALSSRERPIILVGDDRVLLRRHRSTVVASPHPRIAGLIERRGCGILAMSYRGFAAVCGFVDLAAATTWDLGGQNFPALALVTPEDRTARTARVLAWVAALPQAARADLVAP